MSTVLADAATPTSWPDVALAAILALGSIAALWIFFR